LAVVALAFLALSILWTWPLAARLTSRVPHDPGDPILNTWILWWNAQAFPFTAGWWNAPVFYPMRDALALSEHLAGLTPFSTPLLLAGLGPLGTYNAVLILTFALSAFFAHLLVFRLTGSRVAAACAGLAYGFSPYRISQLGHLQVVASQWMPLALLALHEYLGGGRRWWLAAFAIAWLLQALSNGYYLLFLPVLIGLWLAWFVHGRIALRRGTVAAGAWVLASLPLVPVLLKYHEVHRHLGLWRPISEMRRFSATAGSFVHGSALLWFWPYAEPRTTEDQLFPGLVAPGIVAAGVVAALTAGWPAVRRAVANRSPLAFYTLGALLMWMLALGPVPEEAGISALWHPYSILTTLPGFDGLRVPARFAMLATLCISVAAGLTVARLMPRSSRARAVFASLVIAAFAADGWMRAMPLFPPPSRVALPEVADAAVVELPPDDAVVGVRSMYRSMFHGRPVVSGYSGHRPPHLFVLSLSLRRGDPSVLTLLARERPLIIMVDERRDEDGELDRLVRELPGVQAPVSTGAGRLYVLPRLPSQQVAEPGAELAQTLQPEHQRIDFGTERTVRTIAFDLRDRYFDFGVKVGFQASLDGATWTTVWEGWTGAPALAAMLRDPQAAPVRITLPDVRTRYVRLDNAPGWLWDEIRFHGP
jgi:hypothetical protein